MLTRDGVARRGLWTPSLQTTSRGQPSSSPGRARRPWAWPRCGVSSAAAGSSSHPCARAPRRPPPRSQARCGGRAGRGSRGARGEGAVRPGVGDPGVRPAAGLRGGYARPRPTARPRLRWARAGLAGCCAGDTQVSCPNKSQTCAESVYTQTSSDRGCMHELWATSSNMRVDAGRGRAPTVGRAQRAAGRALGRWPQGAAGPCDKGFCELWVTSYYVQALGHFKVFACGGGARPSGNPGRDGAPRAQHASGEARLPVLSTPWAARRPQGAAGLHGGEPARDLRRQPGRGGAAAGGGGRGAHPPAQSGWADLTAGHRLPPTSVRSHRPPRLPGACGRSRGGRASAPPTAGP